MKSRKRQRGYLLITVVVALFLLATVAVLLTRGSAISANTASSELEAARAKYVAEAGMQHALWRAQNNACMGNVTIPATTLGPDRYAASITGAAAGTAYLLSADQDAWIRSDDVTKNNGTTAEQHIRFESGNTEHALTRFDLSSLPAGSQVNAATAWFHITTSGPGGGAHPEGPVTVHSVTADWTETDATWATMNGKYDSSALATIPSQPDNGVWVSFNLTGQVQAWVNGQPNYGILMRSIAEGVHGKYSSREDGGNAPRLEVVVGSGQASPVSVQATGTLDSGVTRTVNRPTSLAYQPPGTVILQLGTDPGADAMLDSFYPRNYGGANYLQINSDPSFIQRPVLQFGLGGVPAGAKVLSAKLELNLTSLNSPGTASVHQLTRAFVEGTQAGGGVADGATWDTWDGTSNWSTPGGDFNALPVAEGAINAAGGWVSWDIAELVSKWLGGDPNYGLLIDGANGLRLAKFASREDPDASRRPKLTIEYACECGSACMAPQGTGTIAMVVVNPTTLVPADAYKKALFESWGYTVDVISESANQAEYDAKAASGDVFFISETVNSNQVGNKLVDVPIGVVSQDGSYNSDLGLAGGSSWPVSPTINVTDTSHYITAIFPAGPLDIYSASMEQLTVSGGAAAGLQTLADTSGPGSLVALDMGAALLGGGSAAARRVMLPIGREGSVNWDYLNNNGRLIVQRAIAWAMSTDAVASGSDVLLVVVDPANLTAQEVAKQTLLESWGHSVSLIDESASQADFDAAVATADVAYVAEDITSGTLGTKLREATIGVVIEEEKITDEFGISSGETTFTEASIEVTNNAHYITEPFSPGVVTFSSLAQQVGGRAGTLAPDLAVLAQRPSSTTSMLDVIDAGGLLFDTGTAAGRRVKLPWGGNGFDINSLTDDGRTIMRRALEWSAGSGCGTTTSLWMLAADANNPTAEENSRQTLLESWCYAVTLGTASEPLEVYDKYAAEFDVVYVPASVNYTDVGTKLKFQPIGVVAEPSILSSRLGFTSGTSGYTGTVTELTDNSHYITSGFPLGNLALTTTSTSLRHFTNTMGPGFKTLSVRPTQTNPMIMTLDTGDELLWGGNAPDRRVMLPWGGSSTFDVNNLTDDGLTILQRSLEWVAAEKSLAPIAHWKLDDGTGTTAVDSEGGHDGTLINGPVWVTGRLGDALNFDSNNDYVDLTSDAELDDVFADGATVMAWIEPAGWGGNGYGRIFDKSTSASSTGDGWAIRLNTDNNGLNFGQGFSSGRGWWKIPNNSINFGVWQHIAVAYDASSTANDPNVYLNGSPVTVTRVDAPSGTLRSDASINLRLGNHAAGTSWSFDGAIDDARIYDRMLDAAEIAEIATGGGSGGGGGGSGGAPAEYVDNFDATVYNGSDGVTDWSGDPWQEITESDGPTSGKLFIAADPVIAESGSQRLVVDSRLTGLKRPVNLLGFSSAYLSFNYRRDGYPTPSDYFSVLVSDNGSTWTQLDRIYGIANDPVYRPAVYDISKFISAKTEIQIATGGINNMQTLFVDNVRVASTPLAGCAGTFGDQFDAKAYNNSDGTLPWASDWTEIKESDGPTKGDIQVRNEINNYQLRVRDAGYGVWREADLSGTSQATLSLDYKRINLDSSSDYVTVEVSSDGGSTWTELDRFQGGGSDNLYQYRYYDITDHATANARIRFLGSSGLGGTDEVWFDDIEIVCTP